MPCLFSHSLTPCLNLPLQYWLKRNEEEAYSIGSLLSLTIFQFPSVKWQIREREGNEKNPFPLFGNGIQRLSFPGMDGNGNSRSSVKMYRIKHLWLTLMNKMHTSSRKRLDFMKQQRQWFVLTFTELFNRSHWMPFHIKPLWPSQSSVDSSHLW